MTFTVTPPVYNGPTGAAIDFVNQGWSFFEDKSILFMNKALLLIDEMSSLALSVAPTDFTVFFPDVSGLTAFVAPTKPVLPDIVFNEIDITEPPSISVPSALPMVAAPVFDVQTPTQLSLPTQPGELNATDPGDAPELSTLVLPDTPSYLLPDAPEFLTISLPAAPELITYSFAGVDPGSAPTLPNLTDVGFIETPYTREILDDVLVNVRSMLADGGGLPIAIEFALFQRGRGRLDRTNKKALHEINDRWSGRGFTLPPGSLNAELDEQVQKNQDETLGLNTDIMIQQHKEKLETVRFAVQQGIALEQVLISQHGQMMDRALQSARLLLDTHVALFNAQVSGYNAAVNKYQVDAEVFKAQLQAELNKVEVYKALVDGQRAIADVNRATADAYKSRIDGIVSLIEIYKSQIAAVEAQSRIEVAKIEGYRAKVSAYSERIRAYEAQWGGFTSAVNAQGALFKNFEIGVSAFSTRTNAWAEGERAKSARYETDMRGATLALDQYKTRITGQLAQLQVESERLRALSAQSTALTQMYQADASIETARNDANTRAFQAATELASIHANVQLEEAKIKIQNAQQGLLAQLEAIKGASAALAQLCAASMSAVNFSAGVSGSGSESSSFSYSLSKSMGFSWSGESTDSSGTASIPAY
jgi:hypothetical protein